MNQRTKKPRTSAKNEKKKEENSNSTPPTTINTSVTPPRKPANLNATTLRKAMGRKDSDGPVQGDQSTSSAAAPRKTRGWRDSAAPVDSQITSSAPRLKLSKAFQKEVSQNSNVDRMAPSEEEGKLLDEISDYALNQLKLLGLDVFCRNLPAPKQLLFKDGGEGVAPMFVRSMKSNTSYVKTALNKDYIDDASSLGWEEGDPWPAFDDLMHDLSDDAFEGRIFFLVSSETNVPICGSIFEYLGEPEIDWKAIFCSPEFKEDHQVELLRLFCLFSFSRTFRQMGSRSTCSSGAPQNLSTVYPDPPFIHVFRDESWIFPTAATTLIREAFPFDVHFSEWNEKDSRQGKWQLQDSPKHIMVEKVAALTKSARKENIDSTDSDCDHASSPSPKSENGAKKKGARKPRLTVKKRRRLSSSMPRLPLRQCDCWRYRQREKFYKSYVLPLSQFLDVYSRSSPSHEQLKSLGTQVDSVVNKIVNPN